MFHIHGTRKTFQNRSNGGITDWGVDRSPSPNLGDLRDWSVMEYYLAVKRKNNAICSNMDVPRDYQAE